MKKIFSILLLFFAFSEATSAQTEKGNLMLGGNLSFQAVSGNSSFITNANIGYFLKNNVAVGGQLSLYVTNGYNSWGIGPFVRGYFLGNEKGKLFGQGSFSIGGAKNSDVGFGFGVGAGYAVFLNKSIAVEFGTFYNRIANAQVGVFLINAGFQIHFKK